MSGFSNPCRPLALALLLLAAGCATLPQDQGRPQVASLVAERGRDASAPAHPEQLIDEFLSRPLTSESAVRVALVNSPRLKTEYARLGIASAAVYDRGRLSNPKLSAAVLDSNTPGAANQKTFAIAQSFTSLLLLPARGRFAARELSRVQQSVGAAVLDLAADVERAYYLLVSAEQVLAMREAVARAAQASADLAQRFVQAGNITRRDLAWEQAAATQARLDVLNAQTEAARAKAALSVLMGLGAGARDWTVAPRLSAPLAQEDDLDALLSLADRSRPDIVAAREEVAILADARDLARRFGLLGDVQVGFEQERESDHSRLTGPTLSLQLPLFNRGAGAVAGAEAQRQQAEAELSELQIEIVNALREAHASVLNAKARAVEYRDRLIPQREEIVARTQEQVSYMLEGQFELLLVKRQEYDAYQGYLEAVRDYWLARTDLARAVGTTLPSSAQAAGEMLDTEALTRPRGAEPQHEDMDDMNHGDHPVPHDTEHGDQP